MIEIKQPSQSNPPPVFRWQQLDGATFTASLIIDPSTTLARAKVTDTGRIRLTTAFSRDADDAEMCATLQEAKDVLEKRWLDWMSRAKPALESGLAWAQAQPVYAVAALFKLGPHANSKSALCLAVARVKGVAVNPELEIITACAKDILAKHPKAVLVDRAFSKVDV